MTRWYRMDVIFGVDEEGRASGDGHLTNYHFSEKNKLRHREIHGTGQLPEKDFDDFMDLIRWQIKQMLRDEPNMQ